MTRLPSLLFLMASVLLGSAPAWAANITMTTYYPSPTGRYDQLSANNLSIGTTTTDRRLEVAGDALISNRAANSAVNARNPGIRFWEDGGFGAELHFGQGVQSAGWATALYGRSGGGGTVALRLGSYPGTSSTSQSDFVEDMTILSNGNVGIGATIPVGKLDVRGGAVCFSNTAPVACPGNHMQAGSLTIGDAALSYGGGNNWNANNAGLMMETAANTEIAIHDSGTRLASLLYYEGDGTNRITMGRDMAWGPISIIALNGNVGVGVPNPAVKLEVAQNEALKLGNAYLSSGGDFTHLANNEYFNGGAWVTNGNPGVLLQMTGQSTNFYRHDAGGAHTFSMVIDPNGRVGIGNGGPTDTLDVAGAIGWGASKSSYLGSDQGGDIELGAYPGAANPVAGGVPYFDFHYGNGAAQDYNVRIMNSADNRLDINTISNGTILTVAGANVGIANASPSRTLDVAGHAIISGQLQVGSCAGFNGYSSVCGGGTYPTGWGGGIQAWDIYSNSGIGTGKEGGTGLPMSVMWAFGRGEFRLDVWSNAFYYYSDERLKKDIHPLVNALDKIKKLNGVSFKWKKTGAQDIGLIAQNVEKIFPDVVKTDKQGMKSVEYGHLTAVLVEAIKEQQKEIETLKTQVAQLQKTQSAH